MEVRRGPLPRPAVEGWGPGWGNVEFVRGRGCGGEREPHSRETWMKVAEV